MAVEKDFHDATEIDDEFLVVFAMEEELPCLCYRKSEWALIPKSFNS